jgi:hypothetical protein
VLECSPVGECLPSSAPSMVGGWGPVVLAKCGDTQL